MKKFVYVIVNTNPMYYNEMEINLTENIPECQSEEEEEVMPEYYDWREDEENDRIADYINLKKDMLLTSYLEDGYSYKEAREAVKHIFEDDD